MVSAYSKASIKELQVAGNLNGGPEITEINNINWNLSHFYQYFLAIFTCDKM